MLALAFLVVLAGRQPQLAEAGVAYGEGQTVSFTARGAEAIKVAELPGLALGRHRGPRIASNGSVVSITAIGREGDVLAWHSKDGGTTWSSPVRVNDVPGSAREGLHAMAAGGGRLYAAWLDLRGKGTKLYTAWSGDGGATWSPNILAYESPDGTICECCHPSLAAEGPRVYAMWRNWVNGSRDMYLARSEDGGQSWGRAAKLGRGTWPLKACPMDGGGLSAGGSGVQTVWRRGSEVFLSRPEGAEERLGQGKDPAVAGSYVAWTSPDGLVLRTPRGLKMLSPAGGFARLLKTPAGVLVAWEENGTVRLQTVQ